MKKNEIARKYLEYLESGDMEKVISLFSENGIVDSPVYGIKKADEFYYELNDDTSNSKIQLKGIFEQKRSNDFALYFSYEWTLKSNRKVDFDVVDIIELDSQNKIKRLKIIYDTVISRKLVNELNE
ncbi:nuclear transport factor 2 family protein [Algibacter aquimarinus]|uniref:SnoaL-like domain-containing protein n=1 Tax=Algibacter aquimarinus TaxID=1136748 RepID=A0ABP9H665_9FLAO